VSLSKRSGLYLLLLLVLALFLAWMLSSRSRVEIQAETNGVNKKEVGIQPSISSATLPSQAIRGSATAAVDVEHQKMADELHNQENPPERDLEIVQQFLTLYGKAFKEGMPTGDNGDITAALIGVADVTRPGQLFPRNHRAIRDGQLIDRWGTPFWFHPNSSSQMEIRSGGPDKQMFTQDDVILNPSPAGFGATAPGAGGNE
jgi:hypothetical protein